MLHRVYAIIVTATLATMAPVAQADTQLIMQLAGIIEPRCELLNIEKEKVDLSETSNERINFSLYCNIEMSMQLESSNGGLLNTKTAARTGFDEALIRRYKADVAIDSIGFETQVTSRAMVGGALFQVTGGVVFESQGSIEIVLDEPLGEGYAGEYTDEIKINIFPSLSYLN